MKKAHFIGICGAGMSGVAKLLIDAGYTVSGSDSGAYPPISTYIDSLGIQIATTYSAQNIPDDAEFIVIGKNAKLVPETNEEVRVAMESGIHIYSFAEVVGRLINHRAPIVVAGSFGKSTTSSLLSWSLTHAKKDPGYFVGAVTLGLEHASALGKSEVFILEGDEYPSANFDTTSKFLHYGAHDVLLISGAHDHVNIFPTVASYLAPFRTLLKKIPKDGIAVGCIDNENVSELLKESSGRVVTYSLENSTADYYAKDIVYGETTCFSLMHKEVLVVKLTTTLLGAHNIQNIVGASALLLEKNLLTHEELPPAIASFKGVKRRLERKNTSQKVFVYEGFGSSVHKARSAIEAIKLHFPEKRLLILFEPYEFSWRNREMLSWYDYAFTGADKVFVYKPAVQGADTHEQLSQEEIVSRIQKSGIDTVSLSSKEEGEEKIKEYLKEGDVVLMMSSGTIGGLIESVPLLAEGV